MPRYEIVVGNVGMVYAETLYEQEEWRPILEFEEWVARTQLSIGRAAGEAVTLFKDGEIFKEHEGDHHEPV